ncbi:MAG TPA: RDD family protein [Candidatus Angelobacter sp.]|nr:RDD family protein [Candidatus Angelobacter sp.]
MPSDKLIIDTPEQVHLEFVLAGIGSRFMAVFLDVLIEALVYLALFLLSLMLTSTGLLNVGNSVWWIAFVTLVIFCINWGYYAIFEALWKGQTPGKRWAGIRVIKDSGRPINAFEAISRNLVRAIDFLPGFYGVGVVTMLLNAKNRRLGDYVAGTIVVHESSDRESSLFFNTPTRADFTLHQAAGLTIQEAELIETFLARRLEIPPEVRRFNGQRIADMISARLNIPPESRPPDNENFLELMVREFRSRAQYR